MDIESLKTIGDYKVLTVWVSVQGDDFRLTNIFPAAIQQLPFIQPDHFEEYCVENVVYQNIYNADEYKNGEFGLIYVVINVQWLSSDSGSIFALSGIRAPVEMDPF